MTTPIYATAYTPVVSAVATSNHPNCILEGCVNNEGEALSTMEPMLEMVAPIPFVVCQQMCESCIS